ncbi:lipid carrier--UDP-N-acetylgalactosaminyltransferase [Chryseotalea sanaruensis]|uniref:Lipid carrier--UDP-N-acetylgalactosaminyltransferase n=1 Tax=Chryseotalea sanaruensis TaxID=2482724 RepID=A0A401U6Q3_9BACT|nr:sugar transferase [Chryseotalea sanaruensis]GCC50593.1 lipid carrier--UDP-N-acetylgalactosaminyltransferase [Chryseotalea sanaruensis]
MYKRYVKRLVDIILSITILLISSPIFIIIILLLTIQNKGTVFFLQERPGYLQRSFQIIKFKTMNDARDNNGNLMPDKQRLTSFGKWIRKLSLDELPQLVNVLKGEMSLIGPRPLLFKYIPLYSPIQNRRHEVRPGITGWAQVNGRNSISWTKRFELDVYYVDNISFALDCRIFWMTIVKVLKREGINQSEARPMEPFNGSN